jgi:subtilisin-like proprotein convertase family protein
VSGTSQAAPEVTGLSALVREHFRTNFGGGTSYPSPAMTKALIVNTASDLVGGDNGAGATNANVPTQVQGWGRVNLGTIVDGTHRQVVDQASILKNTGSATSRFYDVFAPAQPLRVTLAWTDPPGPTTGNAFVNDLDLEVTAGGNTYKANVFSGGRSVIGGTADPRNNLENVFLPAGVSGRVKVRVIAKNLAGDGVPGTADTTDQDYALVVSNVGPPLASAAVLTDAGRTVTLAGGETFLRPGGLFVLSQVLRNIGNVTATGISGTMSAPASDASITTASSTWPNIGPNGVAANTPRFRGVVNPSRPCGADVRLTIDVSSSAGPLSIPVTLNTGHPGAPTSQSSTDVPKAIPDNNATGASSTLAVAASGLITDIDATIGQITHTFDGDLIISLTSPAGTTVRLANRNGSSGDNFTNTVFDDAAAVAVSSGSAPFTGSFRPFEPLSAFNGQQVQGTWTLKVVDVAAADTGTLSSWGIRRVVTVCS